MKHKFLCVLDVMARFSQKICLLPTFLPISEASQICLDLKNFY